MPPVEITVVLGGIIKLVEWNVPKGAMVTTSDPYKEQTNIYKTGSMDLGVMYAMSENYSEDSDYKNYHVGTFNQGIIAQNQIDSNGNIVSSTSLDSKTNSWRSESQSSNDNWSGFLNGFLNIDDKYPQLIEGSINVNFNDQNDRVKIDSTDSQFYKLPFLSLDASNKNLGIVLEQMKISFLFHIQIRTTKV